MSAIAALLCRSGSRRPLLASRPLRTVHETFASYGSSMEQRTPLSGSTRSSSLALRTPTRYHGQSQLPRGLDGGSRTSKDDCRPADISASLPKAGWLSCHVCPHQREVCPLSGGMMLQPLSAPLPGGLRLLPPPLPAAPSGHLAAPLPGHTRRATGLPRSPCGTGWVRPCFCAGGTTSAWSEFGALQPDHSPFWSKPVSPFGLFL
jgi:hypothetical protein